jgi:hypothetical protein
MYNPIRFHMSAQLAKAVQNFRRSAVPNPLPSRVRRLV